MSLSDQDSERKSMNVTDFTARRTMMVDTQVRPSDVTKFPIIDAMLSVPREAYLPADLQEAAYAEQTLSLSADRIMLEPRTLAKMLDALNIQATDVAMDIACGTGYATAILAHMCDFVVGVEDDATLSARAQEVMTAEGIDNAVIVQDALTAGAPKSGPYDVIIVQGAVNDLPDDLLAQLREGGRIACIFAQGQLGTVRIGLKIDGVVNWRFAFNASAPLLAGFEKEAAFVL